MIEATLPSPCISICEMDAQSDLCSGCFRSRKEIASWGRLSAKEQGELLEVLRQRRTQHTGLARRPNRRRSK